MAYLEGLRLQLPDGCLVHGLLTNLESWIFFVATGMFTYDVSNEITDPVQAALYLDAMFRGAARADGDISGTSETRSILNAVSRAGPRPPDDEFDDGSGGGDEDTMSKAAPAPGGASGAPEDAAGAGSPEGSSATMSLTASSLALHDANVFLAAQRKLAMFSK